MFHSFANKLELSWINYLFKLQNQAEHNTTNITTAPDYSSGTAITLVMFWTELDICIISDFRNSFNNKLINKQKVSVTQQIQSLHLENPLRANVIRLLVCVHFSLGSICKYWICVIDDIGIFTIVSNI